MLQKKASIIIFILLAVICVNPISLSAFNTDQFYLCQNVVNPVFTANLNFNILTCPNVIFSSLESISDKLAWEIQTKYNLKNRHVFELRKSFYYHYWDYWSGGTWVKKETIETHSGTTLIYQYNFSPKFAFYFQLNYLGENALGMVYTREVTKFIRLSSEINFVYYYIPVLIKVLGGVLIKPYRNITIPLEIVYAGERDMIVLTGIDYNLYERLRLGLKYTFLSNFHIRRNRFGANLSFFLN